MILFVKDIEKFLFQKFKSLSWIASSACATLRRMRNDDLYFRSLEDSSTGRENMKPKMNPINTILVYVDEDLLGDGLLKLPFVYALRKAFPQAHITWVSGYRNSMYSSLLAPLVQGQLDAVIDDVKVGQTWRELLRPSPFKNKFFDLIIDTQRDLITTLALKKIPHKKIVSRTLRGFLSDYKLALSKVPRHVLHQLLFLLEAVQGPLEGPKISLEILDPYKNKVKNFFKTGKVYVGLSPGAGQDKKCWPLENFIRIAQGQIDLGRIPVFILGPKEQPWEKLLRLAVPEALFPLQEDPFLLKSPFYTSALGFFLKAGVANDSGTGHLLALSEVPLISLFGTTDPHKIHPLTEQLHILEPKNFGGTAVKDIPLAAVEEALNSIVSP